MAGSSVTTTEVLDRLEILWRKLDDEGMYVRANTVGLAIDELKRLSGDQPPIPLHTVTTRPYAGRAGGRAGLQRTDGDQQVREGSQPKGRPCHSGAADESLRLGIQAEGLAKGEIRFSSDDYPLPTDRHVIEDQLIAGVYFLIKDDVAVYVGKSTNIINRVWSHRKSGLDFDTFTYVKVGAKHQDRIEAAYTAALRPALNCSDDGTPKNPELALHVRYLTSDVDIFA